MTSNHHAPVSYTHLDVYKRQELEGDEKTGAKIILKALEAPLHQIAGNCGYSRRTFYDSTVGKRAYHK